MTLLYSLAGVIIMGAVSLVGALTLFLKDKALNKIIIFLVSFSAGALMGGAFFHLLPEALGKANSLLVFSYLLLGFCLFFILERFLRWRHCHEGEGECENHEHLGWINLIGDAVHNLIDGMIIFAAFAASPALGVVVIISIVFHEIPQELGTFGVLIYSGFSRSKAVLYNLLSAMSAIIGVLLAYAIGSFGGGSLDVFLLPFAAGGFLYIAASDLVPELHKDRSAFKATVSFIIFILALVFMLVAKIYFEK